MKRLSEVLPNTLSSNLQTYIKIKKMWDDCAGDVISFITTPGSLKEGVLNVAVHDQTWLSELAFFKGELVERLRAKGLEVENLNLYYRTRKSEFRPVVIPKKDMTDKERDFADKLINSIDDERLRESFKKAVYGYFTVYSIEDYLNC